MGKTYRSDNDDDYSSYTKFNKKKNKNNQIKDFLDKNGGSDKYEYLNKNQTFNPKDERN